MLTYTSNGDTTPLVIGQIYMKGGTNIRVPVSGDAATTTDSSGSTIQGENPAPSNTSPADSPGKNDGGCSSNTGLPIGAMVGGILDGLTFLLFLLV